MLFAGQAVEGGAGLGLELAGYVHVQEVPQRGKHWHMQADLTFTLRSDTEKKEVRGRKREKESIGLRER